MYTATQARYKEILEDIKTVTDAINYLKEKAEKTGIPYHRISKSIISLHETLAGYRQELLSLELIDESLKNIDT